MALPRGTWKIVHDVHLKDATGPILARGIGTGEEEVVLPMQLHGRLHIQTSRCREEGCRECRYLQ